MSYNYASFQQQALLIGMKQVWNPNRTAEFVAVATALASDTTKHDTTIETAPGILLPGQQAGVGSNTASSVMLADLINRGKAGGLSNSQMISAIDGIVGQAAPPAVIDIPYVSAVGTLASCTTGNWAGTPSSYAYQWKRDGVTNIGTSVATYTMVGADTGHQIGCVVSATNPQGTTAAPLSNFVVGP